MPISSRGRLLVLARSLAPGLPAASRLPCLDRKESSSELLNRPFTCLEGFSVLAA
jgi:hypothetical protein